MNFTVSKIEFFEALQKVIGVVPQKTTISILSCILIDLSGNKLNLTGTDLEISISTSVKVNGQEDGSVAIPAKILVEIVRELPDVPLNIYSDSGNKIILKTEKGEYKISSQPKEDFPKIMVEEGDISFSISSKILGRMTEKTIFAVSSDELRPALTGINVELLQDEIRFVATDGHRLARISQTKLHVKDDINRNLIVPTKTMNLLLRNLDEEEKDVKLQMGEDYIVFYLKGAVIYSKLINGTYPNYERVLPPDNDKLLTINREMFVSALRRVSIFSSSLTHQVRLIISSEELTIRSEDIEFGAEAREIIQCNFTGDWLQIGYNSNYLLDILRYMDTEEVIFELKNGTNSAIIRPSNQKENENLMMLLMPIRINEETTEQVTETELQS